MSEFEYKYLDKIKSPEDLKAIPKENISELCDEIRKFLIQTVEKNGGHLASNLGVVELTVAFHRIFDCPHDHLIFDVGHQSYIHKILTGRYENFDTLRRGGGISGFTKRSESEYDCFGAGHSSTSLSAALGFAISDKLSGSDAYTIAVLGDGAFTGGMIHEALNNCQKDLRLIMILNENEMSISRNIGRFARNLSKMRRKSGYFKAKRFTATVIKKIPFVGNKVFHSFLQMKKTIKNAMYGSIYFEDMGLYYLGPADGNNYNDVEELLKEAKKAGESVVIHLKTQKGKGYKPAEDNPGKYHSLPAKKLSENAVDESDRAGSCGNSGEEVSGNIKPENRAESFSGYFGNLISEMADKDDKICAITAAMSSGTGLDAFAARHKERFFDVGIAEEHAVTFAAGLAANGYKPVVAIYSTFLQRSYDQIIHDVALQNLPVVFCVDRAGLNSSDGATHHGIFDVAFMSEIPGLKIYAPVTYRGLEISLKKALSDTCPSAVRYPNGTENDIILQSFYKTHDEEITLRCDFEMGHRRVLIITHGRYASESVRAENLLCSENISCGTVLCEYIRPYDSLADEISEILEKVNPEIVIFAEEEIKAGGFGMMLSETLREKGKLGGITWEIVAVDDDFVIQKTDEPIYKSAKISAEDVVRAVIKNI